MDGIEKKKPARVRWCLGIGGGALAIGLAACTAPVASEPPPPGRASSDAGKEKEPRTDAGGAPDAEPAPPANELLSCDGEDAPTPPPACNDEDTTCKSSCGGSFKPPRICRPAKPKSACTDVQIEALAAVCSKDPMSVACTSERASAANKDCSACIFGTKDEPWRAILLQPEALPTSRYNQSGCIDLATGIPDCGKKYFTATACFDAYCSECTGSEETACHKDVASGPCKSYLLDAACGDALNAADAACFPKGTSDGAIATLFSNMAKLFCKP